VLFDSLSFIESKKITKNIKKTASALQDFMLNRKKELK